MSIEQKTKEDKMVNIKDEIERTRRLIKESASIGTKSKADQLMYSSYMQLREMRTIIGRIVNEQVSQIRLEIELRGE